VARDALLAASSGAASRRGAGGAALAARAAGDALNGGDAAGALAIASSASPAPGDTAATLAVIAVKVRALSALGRAAEADALVQQSGAQLDEGRRAELRRGVAWGWIRAGDVAKARAALAASGGEADEGAEGWIALYEGDLAGARAKLVRAADATPELVTARALLSRSRAERSAAAGGAFLALARGDTVRAAQQFVDARRELPDAAPLLLAVAARLHTARHDDAAALPLWSSIVDQYATAPEAAEADLEWGRALRRRGDAPGAVARFEHLILTYPQSALVPQARREMERAKGQTAS
jgi:tetratricopeptide (TPR) repeat protein